MYKSPTIGMHYGDPSPDAIPANAQEISEYELCLAQKSRSITIATACKSTIYAGFDSIALGTLHHYPAQDTDQSNLSASVLSSLLPGVDGAWMTPFWCRDAAGLWDFRMHTAVQIQQVGKDAKTTILMAMAKNKALQDQIAAATSVDSVNAVAW